MEDDQSHFGEVSLSGENELLMLRSKLMEVNESNVTSTESIDSLYLTYVTLLEHSEEMELGLSYRLLSDQIISISKMLKNTPYSISKYLGFTLILSIWILKSQDWYNLDDLSSTDVCDIIIKVIVDCCSYEGFCEASHNGVQESLLASSKNWLDEWGEHSTSYFIPKFDEEEEVFKSSSIGVVNAAGVNFLLDLPSRDDEDYPLSKKRRVMSGMPDCESDEDFKYVIFEITKVNLESLSLLFDKKFCDDLFTALQSIRFQDNTQKNTFFNNIFLLNSIICFYRCSGSFLVTALVFKLPRGRYLLESGVEMVADHLVKEMLYSYQNNSKSSGEELTAEESSIFAIDNISAILWFKTFEARISILLENKIREILDESSVEVLEVDKEYQKMELLSSHSDLINKVFSKFMDFSLNRPSRVEFHPQIFQTIRVKLVKTVLGAIYTTFNIPFLSRNHFMAHFHINNFSDLQTLHIFFNIGYLAQLSVQNCFSEPDIIVQILKTYNCTVFLISRFGESSTKKLFIEELSNGLNCNLSPADTVHQNILSLLLSDEQVKSTKKPNAFHYSLFKFAYSTLLDIKSIIWELNYKRKYPNSKIINSSNSHSSEKVIYCKIAAFFYTLNFIYIILDYYSLNPESPMKPLSTFIGNIFLNLLSESEIEQIHHFVNAEASLYNMERKFFDQNLGFEIEFIKGYLSKFNKKAPTDSLT